MKRTGILFYFAWALLASAWAQEEGPLVACETCGCSSLVGPVQTLYEPGWLIQVNGQYSSLTTGMDGSMVLANAERQRLTSAITQFSAGYNFSQEWGVQLTLPYIARSYRRTAGDHLESGTLSGLGDATLAARFTPVSSFDEESSFVWNVQAGLKLPTGSAQALQEETGHADHGDTTSELHTHAEAVSPRAEPDVRFHGGEDHDEDAVDSVQAPPPLSESLIGGHDLALGSGSVDGLLGTSLFWRQQSLFLNAGAQYLLRTRGSYGYQFGNAFLWNVSPGVLLVNDGQTLMGLQFNLSGENKRPDNVNGSIIDHTGMNALYAGPQFFAAGGDLTLQTGLDLPLYQHTDGATLVPDYRIRFQLNWKL